MTSAKGPLYWITGFVLLLALTIRFPLLAFVLAAVYILSGERYKTVKIALSTLPRDLHLIRHVGAAMCLILYHQTMNHSILNVFRRTVNSHPKKIAFMTQNSKWTFEEVDDYSNQVGRYFKEKLGLKKGDVVALFAEGRPEYVAIWLGLSKVGIITALINTNLRKTSLQHSLDAAKASVIIYGTELSQAVMELDEEKLNSYQLYATGKGDHAANSVDLDQELLSISYANLDSELKNIHTGDKLLYIYTSGTTGLPKAAVITHFRFLAMGLSCCYCIETSSKDTCYTSLPLYHSAGGIIGVSQALFCGATVFIRPKFSASNFWKECVKYKCTMAQYIGEICRFLLATPEQPEETQHSVRVMMGNGLRPQIWSQFVKRFNIPWIAEFYGATEGNGNMINIWNKVGCVGYFPIWIQPAYPLKLVRVNEETKEPIRGPNGLCISAKPGEPALLVSKIKKRLFNQFDGYTDSESTKKKILRNVFEQGDSAFNTGDILICDEQGYFYFRDRTGDTFRWKGENVATSEVEAVISKVVGLRDTIVYGVEIPNNEGKAGMVAITDENKTLNLKELYNGIIHNLSSYARPIFVRVLSELPITGTFKLSKVQLQKDGYDLDIIKDPIYFLNPKEGYVPFTKEMYEKLKTGEIRV